jgi:hypothetical protein
MTSLAVRQTRLKTIFWIVLALNLAEYVAVAYFFASIWNSLVTVDNGPVGILIFLILVALPVLLLFQSMIVLKNYFPARKFSSGRRAFIVGLCIAQIVSSLYLTVMDLNTFLVELPLETTAGSGDIPALPAYLLAISLFLASVANLTASVVLWRTVGQIGRNYRNGAWESFEAG